MNRFFFESLGKELWTPPAANAPAAPKEDDSTPWKDPAMPIEDRMVLLLDVDKLLQPQDAQMLEAALPAANDVKAVA